MAAPGPLELGRGLVGAMDALAEQSVTRPRPAFRTYPGHAYPGRPGPGRSDFADWPARSRPGSRYPAATWPRRKRGRYLALGALSFVLTLGIGAAALALDGSSLPPGTRMTPQMELFSIEHAFVGGTIPMDQGKAPGKIKPGKIKPTERSSP